MARNWTKALLGAGAIGAGGLLWTGIAARAATALVPPDGAFIDVAGGRIHYTDQGEGPVLLLIHGLMGQMRNFSYALTEQLVADHRVIAIDRPGWGHSTWKGEQPGIIAQAGMVADVIDTLALTDVTVVGHSLGGAVALALALNHPDRVARLALIAPLTQSVSAPPPVFAGMVAPPGLRGLLAYTVAIPSQTVVAPLIAKAVFAPDAVPADFGTRGGGALAMRPEPYRQGSFELMIAGRELGALAPRYRDLALPVSILFGKDDNVLNVPLHGEKTAAEIPGAELVVNAGGHMLPVTWPLDTAAFVRRAVAR